MRKRLPLLFLFPLQRGAIRRGDKIPAEEKGQQEKKVSAFVINEYLMKDNEKLIDRFKE